MEGRADAPGVEEASDDELKQCAGGLAVLIMSGDTCNVCGSNMPPMDWGTGGAAGSWRGGSLRFDL